MSSWYSQWIEVRQERKALDRKLEAQWLAREIQNRQEKPVGLLTRILLASGCWLVERAWQLRRERSVLRWGQVEVYQIAPLQNCDC